MGSYSTDTPGLLTFLPIKCWLLRDYRISLKNASHSQRAIFSFHTANCGMVVFTAILKART
jgi:hypothetical protein